MISDSDIEQLLGDDLDPALKEKLKGMLPTLDPKYMNLPGKDKTAPTAAPVKTVNTVKPVVTTTLGQV